MGLLLNSLEVVFGIFARILFTNELGRAALSASVAAHDKLNPGVSRQRRKRDDHPALPAL